MAEERFSIIYDGKYLAGKAAKQAQRDIKKVIKSGTKYNKELSKTTATGKKYSKALTEVSTATGNWDKALSGSDKQLRQTIDTNVKASQKIRSSTKANRLFSQAIIETGKVTKTTRGYIQKMGSEIGLSSKMTTTLGQKMISLDNTMSGQIRNVGKLSGEQRNYTQSIIDSTKYVPKWQRTTVGGLTAIGGAAKKFGAAWKRMGLMFLSLIGPLFLVDAAVRVVTNAIKWAVDPFIKFEDALYELRKTANLTMEEMLGIGDAITKLSLVVPIAADELAKIAATAGRLGIRGRENILSFTETIAKMSVATTLTAEDAAKDLAKIREAFGLPIDAVEYLGSVLNELENTTASTVEELVAGMKNIGASAKMIGILSEEAAALSATLIAAGMSGERSGTRIRRMLTELARKSREIEKVISEDFESWGKTLRTDPMEALVQYLEWLGKLEDPIERVTTAHAHFGKVGGFAIATLTENYTELIGNIETANEEMIWGTSLQREFQIAMSKTSAELQILANRAEVARREIGENLIPTLIWGKRSLTDITESLAILSKGLGVVTGASVPATSAVDAYVDEWSRLEKIGDRPILSQKEALDAWRPGIWAGVRDVEDLMRSLKQMGLTSEEAAKQEKIHSTIMDSSRVSLKELYDTAKEYGHLQEENLGPLRMYNKFLEMQNEIQQGIAESTEDVIYKDRANLKLKLIGKKLFKDAADTAVDYGDGLKIIGFETTETTEATHALTRYIEIENKELADLSEEFIDTSDALAWLNDLTEQYTDDTGKAITKTILFKDGVRDLADAQISAKGSVLKYNAAIEELFSTSWKLYDIAGDLTGQYLSLYNALDVIEDLERDAVGLTKSMIRSYDDERDAIRKLVEEGVRLSDVEKITEAATLANKIALELYTKASKAKTEEDEDAWKEILNWWGLNIDYTKDSIKGIDDLNDAWDATQDKAGELQKTIFDLPDIIAKAELKVEDLKAALEETIEIPEEFKVYGETWERIFENVEAVMAKIDEIPTDIETILDLNPEQFWETWESILLQIKENPLDVVINVKGITTEIAGLTLGLVEEIEDSLQSGGRIPQTGLYELHRGEEVIPAHEVRNYDKKDINVNIRFGGNVPAGVSEAEIKEVVRNEIARAVRANY